MAGMMTPEEMQHWFSEMETLIETTFRSLGRSSAMVALNLRARGHLGRRDNGCECPIAACLREVGVPDPVVGPTQLWYGPKTYAVTLPQAIRVFVRRFDDGYYPTLELPEAA